MSYVNRNRAICINSEGYPASLTMNETYTVLPDDEGKKHGLIRVIDDSGEDYLYPEACFIPAESPEETEQQSFTTA